MTKTAAKKQAVANSEIYKEGDRWAFRHWATGQGWQYIYGLCREDAKMYRDTWRAAYIASETGDWVAFDLIDGTCAGR